MEASLGKSTVYCEVFLIECPNMGVLLVITDKARSRTEWKKINFKPSLEGLKIAFLYAVLAAKVFTMSRCCSRLRP